MKQQNNNDNKALFIIAFAKIAYTVILGSLTGWLLSAKGLDSGFWWGSLSIIMILWTVSRTIDTISFITLVLTCKDD